MSKIILNPIDPTGVQRWLTALVTASNGKKEIVVNTASDNGNDNARQLTYIANAIASGVESFDDVTTTKAGYLSLEGIKSLPQDVVFKFHMPKVYEDRGNLDPKKWVALLEVSQPDMLKAASILATSFSVMEEARKQVASLVNQAGTLTAKSLNPQPVYNTDMVKGKRSSNGDKGFKGLQF